MHSDLEGGSLSAAIEAMLFVTDEPVSSVTIAGILQVDALAVHKACEQLKERLDLQGGIMLQEVAGGWRLTTKPAYHQLLEQYVLSWDTRKLSKAMLEVLAIVAYAQPVTRASIAGVRGVSSDSSLNSLIDKGLVRESGVSDAPGNPTLYVTTRTFLEKMGLRSLADLPPLEQFAPDEETKARIAERLSSAGSHPQLQLDDSLAQIRLDASAEVNSQDAEQAMREMFAGALADSAGLVEKIDFDDLQFEE